MFIFVNSSDSRQKAGAREGLVQHALSAFPHDCLGIAEVDSKAPLQKQSTKNRQSCTLNSLFKRNIRSSLLDYWVF